MTAKPAQSESSASAPSRKEAPGVTKRSSSYFIDPKTVTRREGWNPRFDFGEIEDLAASLVENGMLNPIRVKRLAEPKDGKVFELIDGDRRFTAVESLMKDGELSRFPTLADGIPAHIVGKDQDDKTSFIQMFVANEGKDFLPLEEAVAYKRMHDSVEEGGFGMTIHEICKAVGRKQMHVVNTLALAVADSELRDAVASGEVGRTVAKEIASTARGDTEKQKELTKLAKQAGKGDKAAKATLKRGIQQTKQAKAAKRGKTLKMRALDDAGLSALGEAQQKHVLKLLKQAGKPEDFDLRTFVEKDDKMALAAAFGALEALKAAAGMKTNLKF